MDDRALYYIICVIVYNSFMVGTAFALWSFRNQFYLKRRMVDLLLIMVGAAVWNGNISLVGLKLWSHYYPFPCWVRTLQQYSGGPLYALTFLIRILIALHYEIMNKIKADPKTKLRFYELWILALFLQKRKKRKQRSNLSSDYKSHDSEKSADKQFKLKAGDVLIKKSTSTDHIHVIDSIVYHVRNTVSTRKLARIFFCVLLLEFAIWIIVLTVWSSQISEPSCSDDTNIIRCVLQTIISALTLAFAVPLFYDTHDRLGMKFEFIISSIVNVVCFCLYMCGHYAKWEENNNDPFFSLFNASIFNLFMYVIIQFICVVYPTVMACKEYRYQRKVSESKPDYSELLAILDDPIKVAEFKKILAMQYSLENLKFYELSKELSSAKSTKVIAEAQYIQRTFISIGSPFELNLSFKARLAYSRAARDLSRFTYNDIALIETEVLNMMYCDTLPVYKKQIQG